MSDEKVECQYCGKEYSPKGIKNHESACSKNPVNIEEDEKEEEITVEKVEKSAPKQVAVKLRQDFRCNIGGLWYEFDKGKRYHVPPNVKRILSERDILLPL